MLKAVHQSGLRQASSSFEAHMGCGFGACMMHLPKPSRAKRICEEDLP